ncbi:tetratricopeptide repeat protein [Campylobacter lari]|uniref:tetratricopeptide repeat protein n=1 Tax=Campylobacter lari TaxID=201 RepID=UPI0012CA7ECC|nr:tetratricopeptide repeat protein [Campylobacter lari]EAL0271880.1 tetratricopeptide repeat protein [Campylobacter lari]MCR6565801.1 tetratricopeptide repeat protein [Campylobacter lari]
MHKTDINTAEEPSKNGEFKKAFYIAQDIFNKQDNLSKKEHEKFGWIIYRYINSDCFKEKNNINKLKKILLVYLNLDNEKPSLLHSRILYSVIFHALNHKEINIFNFFKMWNPKYLRDEDFEKQVYNDKQYPSLFFRLIKMAVDNNITLDINYLVDIIENENIVIENIREAYYWNFYQLYKECNLNKLWNNLTLYAKLYSNYGASHWHSQILKFADRIMNDKDEWRFFNFIQFWNIHNFRADDFKEEINNGYINKPLVVKFLNKLFNIIKKNNIQENISWIIELYKFALSKFYDIWLLREYAILLDKTGQIDKAIEIYKKIILELNNQAYIWHEFANILKHKDEKLSISMLCKAITLQPNENFLPKIRLDLAKLLLKNNLLEEAYTELAKYKIHQDEKGWSISNDFDELYNKVSHIRKLSTNDKFYKLEKDIAENYILTDIEFVDCVFYNLFKDKTNTERLLFTNFKNIEFAIKKNKFAFLEKIRINDVYKVKLYFSQVKNKYMVLQINKSSKTFDDMIKDLPEEIAIIDSINEKKELFHYVINANKNGIIHFNQTNIKPKIGNFIKIRYFLNKNNNSKIEILKVEYASESKDYLRQNICGEVKLKYKFKNITYDYNEAIKINEINIHNPDFAFIENYYISKKLLKEYNITSNIQIKAKALFNGSKWNVFDIEAANTKNQ